jgi:sugar-specific transcriptional regulator TrmB
MATKVTAKQAFADLGFNALEAEVYIALLENGSQTAYRIGKLIKRPTANVYKAVEALYQRGVIEIDDSEVRKCNALPIETVAKQFEREYKNKVSQATTILSELKTKAQETGIFKLQSIEAVLQRAKEMLNRCKSVVVADLFPEPMKLLKVDLQKLATKGKEVFIETYAPVEVSGASVVIPEISSQSLEYWKAQQLNLAVDGKEMLVALFNENMTELIQATYSNNLYLSCMMHNGLISEHKVHLFSNVNSMEELEELRNNQKFFLNSKVPGLDLLFKQIKHTNY